VDLVHVCVRRTTPMHTRIKKNHNMRITMSSTILLCADELLRHYIPTQTQTQTMCRQSAHTHHTTRTTAPSRAWLAHWVPCYPAAPAMRINQSA
jgi:hypothetical protein